MAPDCIFHRGIHCGWRASRKRHMELGFCRNNFCNWCMYIPPRLVESWTNGGSYCKHHRNRHCWITRNARCDSTSFRSSECMDVGNNCHFGNLPTHLHRKVDGERQTLSSINTCIQCTHVYIHNIINKAVRIISPLLLYSKSISKLYIPILQRPRSTPIALDAGISMSSTPEEESILR